MPLYFTFLAFKELIKKTKNNTNQNKGRNIIVNFSCVFMKMATSQNDHETFENNQIVLATRFDKKKSFTKIEKKNIMNIIFRLEVLGQLFYKIK